MSEVVEVVTPEESPETETPEVEAPTTPAFDETTWRKRLAGKDQALTATQKERDAIKAQLDELAKWKAERENADLSELEKLQRERDALQAERDQAKAEAARVLLAATYPLAAEVLGEDLTKLPEARVAELNGRLAKEQEGEPDEPRNDPNSPRRSRNPEPDVTTLAAAKAALTKAGNPYFDDF